MFEREYSIAKNAISKTIKLRIPFTSGDKTLNIEAIAPCAFDSSTVLSPKIWILKFYQSSLMFAEQPINLQFSTEEGRKEGRSPLLPSSDKTSKGKKKKLIPIGKLLFLPY
jgi:hypothetical protein